MSSLSRRPARPTPSFLLLCLLLWPPAAAAHPHVFVVCDATLAFDAKGLSAIRQTWVFDEFFTAMILGDLGLPLDRPLDAAAQARVRDHAFVNLRNFGYFTAIRVNGRRMPTPGHSRFAARLADGRLIYDFELPFRAEVGKAPLRLGLSVFDESYYTFIEFPPQDIGIMGAEGFDVSWDVARWADSAYYLGQIVPDAVEAVVQRK